METFPLPNLPARLAWLPAVLMTLGCVPKENPTVPSSGFHPGGTVSTTRIDGSSASEAGRTPLDTQTDASTKEEVSSDSNFGTACDLLKQDCPTLEACYPIAGTGRCRTKGDTAVQGDCVASQDVAFCDRGLACIPRFPGETPGS